MVHQPYHEYTRKELEIGLEESEAAGCEPWVQWYMARLAELDEEDDSAVYVRKET